MKYFRVHTEDEAYLTKQPRGLFAAVGKLADAKSLTENETKAYWKNREYFEKALPVPPFYEKGNPDGAVTWFKDSDAGNRIFREMVFYRRMADKYGMKLFLSECDELPGTLIYEDEFQLAVTGKNEDVKISTSELPWPVRAINEDDIEQVVSVIRESFGTVADELGFTEENAPRFTAFATDAERIGLQLNEEHRPMYGYFDGDRLLGYYSLSPQEEGMCEINNLCVLPGHRHQKIGELLLLDSFSRTVESGFAKMNIGIVEENRILRAWYEKYGFVHLGTKKFDFFPFTCGYMAREL